MVKNKNAIHNKTILKWIYYPAFNMITSNETFYDCDLVFELIRFNIQYNLKTESDFSDFLTNCQSRKLKRKDSSDNIIQDNKIKINFFNFFLITVSFLILLVSILLYYVFSVKLNNIQFLKVYFVHLKKFYKVCVNFILNSMNVIKDFLKRFIKATKKLLFGIFSRLF